jgi:type II secretory pathway component PulK
MVRRASPPPQLSERGVALILVIFVVALASILVIDLTFSTFLGSRQVAFSDRTLKSEYLLKSAVSLARSLIQHDNTPEDGPQDPWAFFKDGIQVPPELLGLAEPNVQIAVEIRPEAAKIPLRGILPSSLSGVNIAWRDTAVRLMKQLGFDEDEERDVSGLSQFEGRVFSSEELVANLIDYMDSDREDYAADGFPKGIDSQVPNGTFANIRINRVEELRGIPGFTPNRIRKLMPFVHTIGNNEVNINIASKTVIKALDDRITDVEVDALVGFREGKDGPFTRQNFATELPNLIGQEVFDTILSRITPESSWFQVIAKVDYGTSLFFARALLSKSTQPGMAPEIQALELY